MTTFRTSVSLPQQGLAPQASLGVHPETGRVRQVIVHRPGLELTRLTPNNIEALLFDHVLWASKAREEHDAFAGMLADRDVIVHHFGELLAQTQTIPEGRAFVADRICVDDLVGPAFVPDLRRFLDDLDPVTMAAYLVGGVVSQICHRCGCRACSVKTSP